MTDAPYTEINEPWPTYERGWWVKVDPTRYRDDPESKQCWSCWCDHSTEQSCEGSKSQMRERSERIRRLGLIEERKGPRYCIQFGADGPFEWHHKDALTLATKSQVAYMEGTT